MKKAVVTLITGIMSIPVAFGQFTAGSVPANAVVINPNISLSVLPYYTDAYASFDIDCDSQPDMRINLHKGASLIDIPNSILLQVLNPAYELCADTFRNFNFPDMSYYNNGDPLNCQGSSEWVIDTSFIIGVYGCYTCTGPAMRTSAYFAYKKTTSSQPGWVKISYDIFASTDQVPITLSIDEVLACIDDTSCVQTIYDTVTVYDSIAITVYDTITVMVYDTAYITITDSNHIAVTDTLIINAVLTGINPPNNINTLKIYPNPAATHITIDNGNYNLMNGYTLRIDNSSGQTIFSSLINQQQFSVNLSTWTGNGTYFVYVIDPLSNEIDVRKIIIQ